MGGQVTPLSAFGLPPLSHPTLPLQTISGLIAAAWGSKWLRLLDQWVHIRLDRSPSGFVTRLSSQLQL